MMASIVALKPAPARLECSSCGKNADAACDCGVAYIPAGARAAAAVAANPEKSDRAIAVEIGVGNKTVSRARATVSRDTVETPAAEPAKRVGRDGKARSMPKRKRAEVDADNRAAFMRRAEEAERLAIDPWGCKVTSEMVVAARRVANEWSTLVRLLEAQAFPKTIAEEPNPDGLDIPPEFDRRGQEAVR